jgi:polyisoprenoid-binding protein YceI
MRQGLKRLWFNGMINHPKEMFMKIILLALMSIYSSFSLAQTATADIKLRPAGSFKVTSKEVKGFAVKKGDGYEAQNIVVGLKNVETGISLRDQHTRKHLEVEKYPEAVLVSAKGQAGKGEGVIKIHGIEKKISGSYKIENEKMQASFPIKLSDFGLTGIKYMGVGVDDEAVVNVSLPIKK